MSFENSKIIPNDWPALPLAEWQATYDTLHIWTQIVGKVRLALGPDINHCWGSTLYVTASGLTTSPIPYPDGIFQIDFDFIHHKLRIVTNHDTSKTMDLAPRSVADFYREFVAGLASLGIDVKIWPVPVEIPNPTPFEQDTQHASYDPEFANRCWRILVSSDKVLKEFRARFIGKASPSHFFWGSFDLAATRFSGRRAPERPDADPVTREAYSHEVISAGWWPGSGNVQGPAFYCYAAPEPAGFAQSSVQPRQAFYNPGTNGFILMYDDVRHSADPRGTLLAFLQSTYEAGANLGKWNRESLERGPLSDTAADRDTLRKSIDLRHVRD